MRLRRTVAAAALALTVAAVALVVTDSSDGDSYEVIGVFESANGLVKTGEVRVAGFEVGRIVDISVEPNGYPQVRMRIDGDYRLRRGATADIRLASQAGQLNRYIALTNGSGPPLRDGATLGLARTDEPVELDDLLSALSPKTRAEVRSLLKNTARTFDRHGPEIDRILRHSGRALNETADLWDDIGADSAALRQFVDRAEDATSQLAAQPAALESTVGRLADLLDLAARRNEEVGQSLVLLPEALRVQRSALTRFTSSIPAIRRVARAAHRAVGPVRPLARELSRTIPAALPLFQSGRELVRVWLPTGRRLQSLFAGMTPALTDLGPSIDRWNPIFEMFRARTPDLLGWVALLGDATASYDAAGHGARVGGGLVEAPKRAIDGSDCRGGWLRRPFDRGPGVLECDAWEDYVQTFIGGGERPESFLTPEETAVRDEGLAE